MEYQEKLNAFCGVLRSGEKSKDDFKIGVEVEHIIVDKKTLNSVNFYQENGIESILKKMIVKGYQPKYEGTYVIGLECDSGVITLEPGGQLEFSIISCSSINEIENIYMEFLENIVPILEEHGQLLMAIGYHPKTSIDDIPFNPKKRYEYMSNHFKGRGKYAHNMMKGTASLQVVIDYSNEEDFIRKYKVANFLSPLLALITDNAPVFEGRIYEKNSVRSTIWDNTDSERGGLLHGAMVEDFGYEKYAQYILNIPPIFIVKDGNIIKTDSLKTEEVMDLYTFNTNEIDHIMSMVFPDVRARKYIELRMADSLPYPLSFAYIALIKGLFYHEDALMYLYKLTEATDDKKLAAYRSNLINDGFMGIFRGKKIYEILSLILDLAKKGLKEEEASYLIPLEQLLMQQKNPAMVSKALIKEAGLKTLEWCSLNKWVGRKESGNREII
ncbi:glutamate--cysteine ligase [Alkaliphilus peptidifermentans]|uniref:Glutamate--cysteine ligase n=1 Tax=Alkaliphilus peptidifermentans DSM 18978 TaxID=1120976 RepID=A0A1G5FM46_9FIRM|nr:glutamate-cysteine ligase family protein [Alkaliphilus peptidifermentans]SCY40273.1 glutamate--cysteine ligase [Alkaliphilus peptidifermentans DSM 18978]